MQLVSTRKHVRRFFVVCFAVAFAGCMLVSTPGHLAYADDNVGDGTNYPTSNPNLSPTEPVFDEQPSQDSPGDATNEGNDDGNASGGSSGGAAAGDSSDGSTSSDSSASGASGGSSGTGYIGYSQSSSDDATVVSESSSASDDEADTSKKTSTKEKAKADSKKSSSSFKAAKSKSKNTENKREFPFIPIGVGVGLLAVFGGVYWFAIRPSMVSAASAGACTVEAIAEEASRLSLLFRHDPKKILIFHDGSEFAHELCLLIQARLFVVGKEMSYKDFDSSEEELAQFKPDLVVFLLNPGEKAESLFTHFDKVKEWYKGAQSGILVTGPYDPTREEELEPLKKSGRIMHYAYEGRNINCALVRFVVPVFKGTIGTNNPMTCIGAVGSVLGIPFVPEACGYYSNGRNMRDVIRAGNIHMDDKICILGDIAGILGIEEISAVVNFVNTAVHVKEDSQEQLASSEMKCKK